jgi:O-antigen/teichoic acid export membrane protein
MDRVAYPLFSTAANDRGLLKRGVRKALSIILLINAPTMLGLLVTARPLVRVLFGERWSPCVPYLQVLCVSGVLWPLHVINLSALKAMGRSDLFFRVEVVKKVVGFAVIIAASMSSILALAWSQIFLGILAYILNAHYVGVHLDYSAMSQLRDNRLCLLAAGIMCAGVWPLGLIPSLAPALLLALQVSAGALIYLLVCRWLKVPAFVEIARELRPRLPWLRILLGSSV